MVTKFITSKRTEMEVVWAFEVKKRMEEWHSNGQIKLKPFSYKMSH